MHNKRNSVFAILLISQFCGTSLWFASNAILPQLQSLYSWSSDSLGYLTSSVQLGFILGTLTLAYLGLSDKYSPSLIFFISATLASATNLLSILNLGSFELLLVSRSLTGVFLAGIYPVGMKIAADWSEKGLGLWLGALVGALVLGTAFPHSLRFIGAQFEPSILLITVSLLAFIGGLFVWLFIPDGPYRRASTRFEFKVVTQGYSEISIKRSAFGYFGHMWELYSFWAFMPWLIGVYNQLNNKDLNVSFWSFMIISSGAIGCFVGGFLSAKIGSLKIARISLIISGLCCLLSPFMYSLSANLFLTLLFIWGLSVVADSPQLSALIAQYAPGNIKGSIITITTCIGFAITIVSIQLLNYSQASISPKWLMLILLPGPIVSVYYLSKK